MSAVVYSLQTHAAKGESIRSWLATYLICMKKLVFHLLIWYISDTCYNLRLLKCTWLPVHCSMVDLLAELNEWGPIFTLWSNSEDQLSHVLSAVAKSVEKCYLALQELVRSKCFFLNLIFVNSLNRSQIQVFMWCLVDHNWSDLSTLLPYDKGSLGSIDISKH